VQYNSHVTQQGGPRPIHTQHTTLSTLGHGIQVQRSHYKPDPAPKKGKQQETQIHHTHLDVGKEHLFEMLVAALVANCSQVWNPVGSHNHNHPWMSHLSQELEMNPGNWMTLSIK